jgi:hypothetical protein
MFNSRRSRSITRATAGSAATFWTKAHNSGWAFEIDGINYLDVRDAISSIEGVDTGSAAASANAKKNALEQKAQLDIYNAAIYNAAVFEANSKAALLKAKSGG